MHFCEYICFIVIPTIIFAITFKPVVYYKMNVLVNLFMSLHKCLKNVYLLTDFQNIYTCLTNAYLLTDF